MRAVYAAILLAVCIARASSLKCYSCNDCKLSGFLAIAENSEQCSSLQNSCRKTVDSSGAVSRGCATGIECGFTTLLTNCDSPSETSCQICCNTDNCNGAAATRASFVGLALALATTVLSRYL